MTDLKKLRDKLNGTELMAPDENEEMLIEEWNLVPLEQTFSKVVCIRWKRQPGFFK